VVPDDVEPEDVEPELLVPVRPIPIDEHALSEARTTTIAAVVK
jgi:hypothetical protein